MALITVGTAWLIGFTAVGAFGAPWWMGAAWIAAILPVLIAKSGLDWRLACASLAFSALAGFLLARSIDENVPTVAAYVGEEVDLLGVVVSEPDPGRVSTSFEVRVEELLSGGSSIDDAGIVRVTLHQYADLLPGDRIRLSGTLDEPPVFDGFDYRSYLRARGIWATMLFPGVEVIERGSATSERQLTRLRLALDRSLQRSLPEPEASLGAGIAFGRDGNLSMERKDDFNASGLRHLVAVSGSNMSMVAAMTVALAVPIIGRRKAWIPAAFTILLYLLVAGYSPGVVRAGIMAGILLAGSAIGRPQSGMPALAAAFILMTALAPRDALEPGFQLSMAATAGLLTIGPWVVHAVEGWARRIPFATPPGWVCEVAALSFTASASTTPIMWAHFGELSLVGPLANILVQPVLLAAFWLSLATAAAGLISENLAWLLSLATYYPLAFIDGVASAASSLPFATASVGRGSAIWAVTAMVPLALLATVAYRYPPPSHAVSAKVERRQKHAGRLVASATVGAFLFAALPISVLPAREPGELRLDFLNVGQGDAILVTAPTGEQLLVDGGPSGIVLARELSAVMPHWDRTLDAVVLTHPQEDHMGGLPAVLDRYRVDRQMGNGQTNDTQTFIELQDRLDRPPARVAAGTTFTLGNLVIEVLWPPDDLSGGNPNDGSVVLRLTYGDVVVLLTGDIQGGTQRQLLERNSMAATVLKVPHHGSRTSSPGFLDAVSPTIAVIQAGEDNRFGHPHPEVLQALEGSRILRTDLHGRITIRTDGQAIRISTEH